MSSTLFVTGVTASSAAWANDADTSVYNYLFSVSGTNTITATGPTSMTAYAAGQMFKLVPGGANTGATTVNINSIGAKNVFSGGAACVGGELVISVPALIVYDGTQFNIVGQRPFLSKIANSLSGDVALNHTGSYFDGPTVAQGTAGTWFASGTVSVTDTAGAANINVKLWDGTTVIASAAAFVPSVNANISISLSGYIASPAGNIRMSVNDNTSTSGAIKFNASGNSKDSTVSAIRIG